MCVEDIGCVEQTCARGARIGLFIHLLGLYFLPELNKYTYFLLAYAQHLQYKNIEKVWRSESDRIKNFQHNTLSRW